MAGVPSLRRLIPHPVYQVLRKLGTAFLAPAVFSLRSGHFQSSLLGRAVDARGAAIPWYTYPTIEFLRDKDLAGRRVLEWGAGQSTLWWAARSATVVAFESDPTWYRRLRSCIPPNVKLHLVPIDASGALTWVADETFDVIVIDGLDRLRCAELSLPLLSSNGAAFLDNSDGYWGEDGQYPILDLFRREGFSRIDFYGPAPGVIKPHCTSLFFKDACFLLDGAENTHRP